MHIKKIVRALEIKVPQAQFKNISASSGTSHRAARQSSAHMPGWESSCSLTSMKKDLCWQTQQSNALREPRSHSNYQAACQEGVGEQLAHTHLQDAPGSVQLLSIPEAPVCSTPAAAGAGVIRMLIRAQPCRGSSGGVVGSRAELTMGTLDQQSPLMAHEHTRDPQQTDPPSSKLQSLQLLKAAYCISDSISHKTHLFY